MDLKIRRTQFRQDGIFGEMVNPKGETVAYTLEHAYQQDDGSFAPKTSAGVYTCQRGMHQLHSMKVPFETFQIMNVPNHTNVLIHMGNWNDDSDGCCLVGEAIVPSAKGQMITNSKAIWAEIMQMQAGLQTFQLTIED